MKNFILFTAITAILFGSPGCVGVIVGAPAPKHDNGKHKGWYKKRNTPNNPKSKKSGHKKFRYVASWQ